MKESCCRFGEHGHLVGITTEPSGRRRRVGCVLVSAGLVPKLGPYRLYTHVARRLARDGFTTLRFDLGGIGDSGHAHGGMPLRARTDLEIGAASSYLLE